MIDKIITETEITATNRAKEELSGYLQNINQTESKKVLLKLYQSMPVFVPNIT